MRLLIIIPYLLICTLTRAQISFDSLFIHSTVVVKARVVSNAPSLFTWDLGTIEGTCDIVIKVVCPGGQPSSGTASLHAGDTLRNIAYAESDTDTISTNKTYLFPLVAEEGKFKLTDGDFNYGIFKDTTLLDENCNPVIRIQQQEQHIIKQTQRGRKTITYQYYPSGVLETKVIEKKISEYRTLYRKRIWGEAGKLQYHDRSVDHHFGRGGKKVIWVFRENGKICFHRRVQLRK